VGRDVVEGRGVVAGEILEVALDEAHVVDLPFVRQGVGEGDVLGVDVHPEEP
jgi:hypothetical protein